MIPSVPSQNTRALFQCKRVVSRGRRCAYAGPIASFVVLFPFVRPLGMGGLGLWQHQLPCHNSSAYIGPEGDTFFFLNLSDRYLAMYPCIPSGFRLRVSVISRGCKLTVGDVVLGSWGVLHSPSSNFEHYYYSSKIVKHAKGEIVVFVVTCMYSVPAYLCIHK